MPEAPVDDGQGVQAPEPGTPADGGQGATAPEASPEPFFTHRDSKGKEVHFSNADELRKWLEKDGPMLRSDYTRKTQGLSQKEKEIQQRQQEIEQKQKQYEQFDTFLKNNPRVFQELKQRMSQPASPSDAAEIAKQYAQESVGEVQKQLEELNNWRQQQEQERQRAEIMSRMKSKYEDFDEDAINGLMEEVDPDNPESLYELLYHAKRGRETPAQIERRLAEAQQKKKQASVLPGSGTRASGQGAKTYDSLEAAARAAKEALGE
jgi:chromosome segregation ATPase